MKMHTFTDETRGSVEVLGVDADIGCCVKCLKVASTAFGYMDVEDLSKALHQGRNDENGVREKFDEASEIEAGNRDATWGPQKATKERWIHNDEFVDFEGFQKEDFVNFYGADPELMGLPAIPRRHPVTGNTVDIFFVRNPARSSLCGHRPDTWLRGVPR